MNFIKLTILDRFRSSVQIEYNKILPLFAPWYAILLELKVVLILATHKVTRSLARIQTMHNFDDIAYNIKMTLYGNCLVPVIFSIYQSSVLFLVHVLSYCDRKQPRQFLRTPDKAHMFIFKLPISSPNPMFDHSLALSHRDDSNKWSNISIWVRNKTSRVNGCDTFGILHLIMEL